MSGPPATLTKPATPRVDQRSDKQNTFDLNLFYTDDHTTCETIALSENDDPNFYSRETSKRDNNDPKQIFATLKSSLNRSVAVDTCASCDVLPPSTDNVWDEIERMASVNGAFGKMKDVPIDRAGDIRADGQPLMSVGKFVMELPNLCFKWEHDKVPVFYGKGWPRICCHTVGRLPYLRPEQYMLLRDAWIKNHASPGESADDFDKRAFPHRKAVVHCTTTTTSLDDRTSPTKTVLATTLSSDTTQESNIGNTDNSQRELLMTIKNTIARFERNQMELDQREWLRHDLSVFQTDVTPERYLELPSGGIKLVATLPEQVANVRRHYHYKKKPGEISKGILSVDLSGRHRRTRQGHEYFLVGAYTNLNGDRPCQSYVRILKTKNDHEVSQAILSVIAEINSREQKQCIFRLHSDKGCEFKNQTIGDALDSLGITQSFTGADDPQANGTSEVLVGQLKRDARALLCAANLQDKTFLWPYAIRHACFLRREPKRVTTKLPTFGQQVVVRIRHQKQKSDTRDDFHPRGQVGMYLGVCETVRPLGAFVRYSTGTIDEVSHLIPIHTEPVAENACTANHNTDCAHLQNMFDVPDEPESAQEHQPGHYTCGSCRRGGAGRHTKRPGCKLYDDSLHRARRAQMFTKLVLQTVAYAPVIDESQLPDATHVDIPVRDIRRMQGREREEWFEATLQEFNSLKARGVITVADRNDRAFRNDPTIERLPSSAIYTLKAASIKGGKRRKKCRVVCCGNFSKVFDEVYTATLDSAISRMVTRVGAGMGYTFGCVDVKTAFLYADIPSDRRVLVRPPKLLVELGVCEESDVWILNKALYGLRESPRYWGQCRDKQLRSISFRVAETDYYLKQSSIDEALWDIRRKGSPDSERSYGLLSTYVDDLLGCSQKDILSALFSKIADTWETTPPEFLSPGNTLRFLGVDLEMLQDGSVFMGQQRYVDDMLKKFDMEDCKPCDTLGDVDTDGDEFKTPVSPDEDPELFKRCQSCLGALLWLSTRTRVDLAYSVSRAAQLLSKDIKLCWALCKRMLRYLCKYRDLGIHMTKFENPDEWPPLESFSDASFAPTSGPSQSGVVVMWGGAPIIWRSNRQTLIAQSTAESELVALVQCMNTSLGFYNVLSTVNIHIPVHLYSDNKACLANSKEGSTWRSRHYLIRAAALRQAVQSGIVHLHYVCSKDQVADYLTKYLPRDSMNHAREISGLRSRSRLT